MTMDVSRLGIVVESKGVKEATTALAGSNGNGGLAKAAEKAEKNVDKLTATMGKLMSVNASATANAWAASMGQLGGVVSNLEKSLKGLTAQLDATVVGMNMANQASGAHVAANERATRSGNVFTNTLRAMATAATVYGAINFTMSIVKQADAWQLQTSRLEIATGSLNNAKVAQNQMYDMAQRLRVPLEEQVRLYTRMAPAMQRMGRSSSEAKDTVEAIATALQLGGANGAEMSSVMLQLSQSYSSGVLNGAEFNAVAENGSVIMRALMAHTGKTQSELKKLGSEGKLSVDTLNDALMKALPKMREDFDKLPLTFEGGMQRIKNAWTKAVGEMGQDTGFNVQLSKSLSVFESMIPGIARGIGEAFISIMQWVDKNRDKLNQVWDQIVGIGKDVWNIGQTIGGWIGFLIGAGDEVSVVGAMLFGLRTGVAAIQDGFSLLVGIVAKLGGLILKYLIEPVATFVNGVLAALLEGFSTLFSGMSTAATTVGLESIGSGLKGASEIAGGMAQTMKQLTYGAKGYGDAMSNAADEVFAKFSRGEGAVSRLWNETKEVNLEMAKVGKMDEAAWGAKDRPKAKPDPKAQKAAEAELKRFQDAMTTANAKLEEQLELRRRLAEYGLGYDKIGPAQKQVIALTEKLATLEKQRASSTEISHTKELLAKYKLAAALERQNENTVENLRVEKDMLDKGAARIKQLQDEAQAIENKVAAYGKSKGAIEAEEEAQAKAKLADLKAIPEDLQTNYVRERISMLEAELAVRERITKASEKLGALEAGAQLDKLLDPRKAEKFGESIGKSFGKASEGIGKVITALEKQAVRQKRIAEIQKVAAATKDPKQQARAAQEAMELEAESRIATYAEMAGAAKSFFKEGTKGYKVMEAAEKTFRIAQAAMQMESFLRESGIITAITSLFVTSKAAETTAEVASVGPHVAAEGAKQGANATTALTNALTLPFPANLAAFAVVAAMLAAIGVAVGGAGGGKSVDISKKRQEAQGTGTVFGDSSAKSESISKSIELLADNSDIALRYSSGMLASLQSIEQSLTGATSGVLRSNVTGRNFEGGSKGTGVGVGIAAGAGVGGLLAGPLGLGLGGILGGTVMKALGFGQSVSLKDAGLIGSNQSVSDILSGGFDVAGYQEVNKKKKAFGVTYSNKTKTNLTAIDPAISKEFGNVVEGMVDSITSAAQALGFSGDEVRRKLEAVNIDIGKISLKGLSSEDVQKQLEAVFSAIGDKLATVALPSVEVFQKAGEGLLETAVRVATGVEKANYELEKLGVSAISYTAITAKNGDVGAEIVRQSILVKEASSGIGEIIATLSGEAADIADTYKELLTVQNNLKLMGIAGEVNRGLIRAAGGLDALKDALESYNSNFFTEQEQYGMKLTTLRKEFEKLNVTMPESKTGFRTLITTLSSTGAAGQELAMKVLLLADSFADVADYYDQGLKDKITDAHDALSDAYERESEAIKSAKEKFLDFSKSLSDFRYSLILGSDSPLNAQDKYGVEKSRFEDVLLKVKAGDTDAMDKFQDVAKSFLEASRAYNASGTAYTSDFERVLSETATLEQLTGAMATDAEKQLEALNKQVDGILTLNETVLSVKQALDAYLALQATGSTGLSSVVVPTIDGSHANGLDYVPFDGYIAELHKGETVLTAQDAAAYRMDYTQYGRQADESLVNEIKALREQVASLREGQREQTGQLIAATYDSQEQNAQAVVEGTRDALSSSNYSEKVKVNLV